LFVFLSHTISLVLKERAAINATLSI